MAKKLTPINYAARDFESIKDELIQYAKRYYPETYRDFNQASFGSLMMDMVSYVGDNLSFYLDYQANESFFDTATERKNVIRHSKQMGYKFRGTPSSVGACDFYIVVPANSTGLGPDRSYIPILKNGTQVSSVDGALFILSESIDFADPANPVVPARVSDDTGLPVSYAIKATGKVISGDFVVEQIRVDEFERFRRVYLSQPRVAEVVSVFDDQGNEYVEVDYLSQNVVYKEIGNHAANTETVASILKPIAAARRYVIEQDGSDVYLQFGYGSDSEITTNSVADPSNLVMQLNGKDFIEDSTFDPSKLLDTDKFGVAPSNTTLTITYRVNTVDNVNASSRSVTTIVRPVVEFGDPTNLNENTRIQVINSLECANEDPIVGDVADPTIDEIRRRATDYFATQNRAVTKLDYESIAYAMPPQFGAIKRCNVMKDSDSFKRNINMYVLAENANGTLTQATDPLKENLKTWISKYKMIHDTIDVIDGRVVNFGIEFAVITDPEYNKYELLETCSRALAEFYSEPRYFGEALYITDVFFVLNKLDGVIDTYYAKFIEKVGSNYSTTSYSFEQNMSADGRYLRVPQNVCMELRFPRSDIKGVIK
jgi:hypothetical protein